MRAARLECGWAVPPRLVPATTPGRVAPPDPTEWPTLWARCWARIRSWRLPPRWSPCQWQDEARAHGALAAYEALRAFESSRLVPLDAFLYRRVLDAVWTRYRQEWAYGRRAVPLKRVEDDALARSLPDPDLLEQMTRALDRLSEPERRLIRQLFWDGSSLDELSGVMGVSREALMKRKGRVLLKLRQMLQEPP